MLGGICWRTPLLVAISRSKVSLVVSILRWLRRKHKRRVNLAKCVTNIYCYTQTLHSQSIQPNCTHVTFHTSTISCLTLSLARHLKSHITHTAAASLFLPFHYPPLSPCPCRAYTPQSNLILSQYLAAQYLPTTTFISLPLSSLLTNPVYSHIVLPWLVLYHA